MYIVLYPDNGGFWRWTLKAANHEPIAVSSESYVRKSDAEHGIRLMKSATNAPVYERESAKAKAWGCADQPQVDRAPLNQPSE